MHHKQCKYIIFHDRVSRINIITNKIHIENNKENAGIWFGKIIDKYMMVQLVNITILITMLDNGMVQMYTFKNRM